MRNKPNFIPKAFKYQPLEYREISSSWTAIFKSENNKEYHFEINYVWTDPELGEGCTILIQNTDHRQPLNMQPYKTIKQGLHILEQILDKQVS